MVKFLVGILLIGTAGQAMAQTGMHGPVEIPLRLAGGRLMVPVMTAGGASYEFLLSTGNAQTVLSESAAAEIGDHAGLTVGGLALPANHSVTVPDEQLTIDGTVIPGIVGSNFLNQYEVLVDVPNDRLVLKPIARTVEWEGVALSDPVRLRIYHGIAIGLDVEVNGHAYGATLDLGTPTLVVNARVQTETGIGDTDEVTLGVGTTRMAAIPIRVRNLPLFDRWSPDGDGFVVVGAALTHHCAIAISWVHREIRMCVP